MNFCCCLWWLFRMMEICFNFYIIYITIQHRLDRVLSLTTSLVTPLNFVIVGVDSACIRSFVDADKNDISMADDGPRLLRANDEPVLHMLAFVVAVAILGVAINEPFSDAALLRDCARCFFKLANVVPAFDWSTLWVSEHLLLLLLFFSNFFFEYTKPWLKFDIYSKVDVFSPKHTYTATVRRIATTFVFVFTVRIAEINLRV